jgi:hypothetical protein
LNEEVAQAQEDREAANEESCAELSKQSRFGVVNGDDFVVRIFIFI